MAGQSEIYGGLGDAGGTPTGHRPPPEAPADSAERQRMERRLDEIRRKREAECMMPVGDSRLFRIYRQVRGFYPPSHRDKFSMAVFMEGELLPEPEQKLWLLAIEREARVKPQFNPPPRPNRNVSPAVAEQQLAKFKAWEKQSWDAVSYVRVSGDGMGAFVFVLPPVNGGEGPRFAELEAQLHQQGIKFGVDRQKLEAICQVGCYLQFVQVAYGERPKNGIDGDIIDHFKRKPEIELVVQDDGTIDYRELGWLQTVYEGDVICDIIPPSPPEDGTDVRGFTVPGKPGRKATVPGGTGTRIAGDDTLLEAAVDGVVTFSGQRFRVDPLLIIKGDVDTAVGNLDVVGNVLVQGDVREGFSVNASGDITVRGMVEECTLTAGGNIQVGTGINGGAGGGLVQAGGNVMCRFLENANVFAGGQVVCETIVHSVVYSDDVITAKTGRGAIIGGAVTARNSIEARVVGNASNRSMSVTLGNSAEFVREKREMVRRREELETEISEKEKSIRYLLAVGSSITFEEKVQKEDLEVGVKALKMQLRTLVHRTDVMVQNQGNNPNCFLSAQVLHPPVELLLCGKEAVIEETLEKVRVFLRNDEVTWQGKEP